jgi:hypothetical protein
VLETSAVLAVDRTVARSANVVVRLPTIRAFRPGCMLDVEVVCRQGTLPEDDWWNLHMSVYGGLLGKRGSARLPERLVRLGVRCADGTKATTIEQHRRRAPTSDEPPVGPLPSWSSGSSGGTRRGGEEVGFSDFGLWLWPLPPGETFEFAVEWPFGGIDLTIVEPDGTAIAAAAGRSAHYWPDSPHSAES